MATKGAVMLVVMTVEAMATSCLPIKLCAKVTFLVFYDRSVWLPKCTPRGQVLTLIRA